MKDFTKTLPTEPALWSLLPLLNLRLLFSPSVNPQVQAHLSWIKHREGFSLRFEGHSGKNLGFGIGQAWALIPAQTFICLMTLDRMFHFSVSSSSSANQNCCSS